MHLVHGMVMAEAAAEMCTIPSEHRALLWCSTGCGISLSLLSILPGQGVMVWERGSAARAGAGQGKLGTDLAAWCPGEGWGQGGHTLVAAKTRGTAEL